MSEQALSDVLERSVEQLPVSEPPLADLLHRGRTARTRRRRRAVIGVAAASTLLVIGGIAATQLVAQGDGPQAVQPTNPATPTARAAAPATLTGRLLWVGGPAPRSATPRPGTVHVVDDDNSVDQTVEAGKDGRWTIHLPPGTYQVRATSPGFGSKAGDFDACSANRAVTIAAGQSATVNVYCNRK